MIKKLIFIFLITMVSLFSKNNIYIKSIKKNNQIDIYLVNNNLFDITFEYDVNKQNLISSDIFPMNGSIQAKSKKKITSFFIIDSKYKLRSKYSWLIGDKRAKHNNNYLYRLPYELNTIQSVTQGFNGYFSHKGNSLYAVDFGLKEGTKIFAAREGLVVSFKNDGLKNGGKKYIKEANFIIIKHNDDTYSKYAHLEQNGVKVRLGEKIKRGQFIGYSGNTGYTNGAHLHFLVFKAKNYKQRDSIAIKFISKNGIINKPVRGKKYMAVE